MFPSGYAVVQGNGELVAAPEHVHMDELVGPVTSQHHL